MNGSFKCKYISVFYLVQLYILCKQSLNSYYGDMLLLQQLQLAHCILYSSAVFHI